METLKARRDWRNAFQIWKDPNIQAELLPKAKLAVIVEVERWTIHNVKSIEKITPYQPIHISFFTEVNSIKRITKDAHVATAKTILNKKTSTTHDLKI